MSIRIFLLNIHSDRNAGDLALSRVTVHQLQTNFPDCQITLSMNDLQSYQGDLHALNSITTWISTGKGWNLTRLIWLVAATITPVICRRFFGKAWFGITPRSLRPWMQACLESDIVVGTAGGYYYSTGSGLNLLLTAYSLVLAILAGKPLYFFPQSIGPFKYQWERLVAHWIYTRARIVMVREPISVQYLLDCGIPESKIILLPDVAFGFQGASREAARDWLKAQSIDPENDRPLLGMTVMDWETFAPNFKRQDVYEGAVTAAIRLFVDKHRGKVLLLPQTWGPTRGEDDRLKAAQVAKRLPEYRDSIFVIDQPINPELLQAVFGEMDLVIGTRMHSNIFSISRGVPVIPIGYLHKSLGIAQMAGLGEWVLDIDRVDALNLIEKLEELWMRRQVIRSHLKKVVPNLIEESQKVGRIIAEDFAGLGQ